MAGASNTTTDSESLHPGFSDHPILFRDFAYNDSQPSVLEYPMRIARADIHAISAKSFAEYVFFQYSLGSPLG